MSDDFDRGDFFDDDDFGDSFGDDFGGDFGDDFGDDFADDFASDDFGTDEFSELDAGDMPEDFDFGDEAPPERRTLFGLSMPFVIIIGIIAIILCGGIAILLLSITSNAGPSEVELTVTSVLATNTAVAEALNMTETRNAITNTPTATHTPSDTPEPTLTPSNTPTPFEPSQTPLFFTPTEGGEGVSQDAVAQTATAIAQALFATPTAEDDGGTGDGTGDGADDGTGDGTGDGGTGDGASDATQAAMGATPTVEEGVPGGDLTPGADGGDGGVLFVTLTPGGALPDTGLFDDIGDGGGVSGLLTAGLAALGLVAVIVVARRMRTG